MTLRNTELRDTYTLLAGKSSMLGVWDDFVRWILSWFAPFHDISVFAVISSGDISNIVNIPEAMVMKWYQAFQSTDFVQERDQFRGAILSIQDRFTNGDQIIESLTRGAMWDMTTAS